MRQLRFYSWRRWRFDRAWLAINADSTQNPCKNGEKLECNRLDEARNTDSHISTLPSYLHWLSSVIELRIPELIHAADAPC
jgi:hypothetical protein